MPPQRVDAVNFIRAESDPYFDDLVARSGGVNRWHHAREPTPIDKQAVVRMNRDTLYSDAILDVSQGATVKHAGGVSRRAARTSPSGSPTRPPCITPCEWAAGTVTISTY